MKIYHCQIKYRSVQLMLPILPSELTPFWYFKEDDTGHGGGSALSNPKSIPADFITGEE
jgi:hypothetical protein